MSKRNSFRVSDGSPKRRLIFFTDLDGTLLDHENYSFEPVLPAVSELKKRSIPLIFCSSKTAAEILDLQKIIGIRDPFISENGGAVHFPGSREDEMYTDILGIPLAELKERLQAFCCRHSIRIKPVDEMTPDEFAALTGLGRSAAEKALRREFSLPFLLLEAPRDGLDCLYDSAREFGLKLTRGGRFFHATGGNDKGAAARKLIRHFDNIYGEPPLSIGLGDSLNDLPLLRAVDLPVIIPNPSSSAPLQSALENARTAPETGPKGWNRILFEILLEQEI